MAHVSSQQNFAEDLIDPHAKVLGRLHAGFLESVLGLATHRHSVAMVLGTEHPTVISCALENFGSHP